MPLLNLCNSIIVLRKVEHFYAVLNSSAHFSSNSAPRRFFWTQMNLSKPANFGHRLGKISINRYF